ncbi:MAG TPA: LPS export ABC transporter permease LptG [Nitrospiria bacterium]|nr:LPS export ABC transporter permease LptG [Nitrospiria bacterium]
MSDTRRAVPILFSYIARQYLRVVGLALGSLVLIYLVSEVFSKASKVSQHRPEAAALVAYLALRMPRAAYEVLPLAGLIGSVLTTSLLSRQHEVTALRACGVGLSRIVTPIAAVSLALAAAAFGANWSIIPGATVDAQTVKNVRIEGRPSPSTLKRNRVWIRLEHRTFLNVRMTDPGTSSLYGVRLYEVGTDFQLTREIDAPRVTVKDGLWTAFEGTERRFAEDGSVRVARFTERTLDLAKLPKDFGQIEVKEEHLSYPQLLAYVEDLRQAGINPGRYAVDASSRLSIPFITVVMALIGIPFGLTDTRRGGWGMAVGLSLIVALAYWMVYSLSISLGRGGLLHPWVAAWLGNVLFLAVAAALLIQKRH